MRSWPTAPIIRIVKGFAFGGRRIRDEYALRTFDGAYVIDGARLEASVDSDTGDSIDAWEDVAPVPADDLKNLRDEFRGAPISERRLRALLQVTSTLPPKTVTPLDRAVSEVEEDLSRSMTSLDTSSEEYLALLLEALSNFQELEYGPANPEKGRVLSRITRLCVEWVVGISYADSPSGGQGESEVLAEVRGRVESDPVPGGFLVMTSLAGDAASLVDESREAGEGRSRLGKGLPGLVLTIAHYALALRAKNLEDGE
jgi:hypothetical protein